MVTVITISRQYGGWGDEIASRVCQILDYQSFDKHLMTEVAFELGWAENELLDFSEDNYKIQGFLDRLLGRNTPRVIAQVGTWQETSRGRFREWAKLDETYGISLTRSIIQTAYERDNIVIVGRGGQVILKDKPNAFHTRIITPHAARVQYLHDKANHSWGGAKEAILSHDRASAEYLRRFYDVDWADPALYDLVINTDKLDVEAAAQLIVTAVSCLRGEYKRKEAPAPSSN